MSLINSVGFLSLLLTVNGAVHEHHHIRTVAGPRHGLPCVFPFTLSNGVTYESCAPAGSIIDDHRHWCSTKTDEQGDHVQDEWGVCPPESCVPKSSRDGVDPEYECFDKIIHKTCLQEVYWTHGDSCEAKEGILTVAGPRHGVPCVFPFTLSNGAKYEGCAPAGSIIDDHRHWCSTKTDEQGNHVQDEWGVCPAEKCIPASSKQGVDPEYECIDEINNTTCEQEVYWAQGDSCEEEEVECKTLTSPINDDTWCQDSEGDVCKLKQVVGHSSGSSNGTCRAEDASWCENFGPKDCDNATVRKDCSVLCAATTTTTSTTTDETTAQKEKNSSEDLRRLEAESSAVSIETDDGSDALCDRFTGKNCDGKELKVPTGGFLRRTDNKGEGNARRLLATGAKSGWDVLSACTEHSILCSGFISVISLGYAVSHTSADLGDDEM